MAADWYTAVWWWDDEIDTCSIEYLIIEQNADSEFPTDDDSERLPWDELDQEDKEKFKFPDVYQASHQPVDYWLAVYRKLLAEYEAQK